MRAGCLLALRTLVALADDPLDYESSGGTPPGAPQEGLDVKVFLPGTRVVVPDNFMDYTRGHPTLPLYDDDLQQMPGKRIRHAPPGKGLPGFNPQEPDDCPEVILNSSKNDPLKFCAPDGESKGQFMYNVWSPELVVYVPEAAWRTDAAVLIAPGGGFRHLDWDTEGLSPAEWFATQGITAFILKYRVPDLPRTVSLMDCQRAMSKVRHLAPKYGLNQSRIGYFGASASALLGIQLNAKERTYNRIDDVDDLPFKPDFMVILYPMIPNNFIPRVSDPEMAPTVMGFSTDDPCCLAQSTTRFIAEAYEKWQGGARGARRRNIFHMYATGGHGWSDCLYYPYLLDVNAPVCFFKENFVRPFLTKILSGQALDLLDFSHWAMQQTADSAGPEATALDDVLTEPE